MSIYHPVWDNNYPQKLHSKDPHVYPIVPMLSFSFQQGDTRDKRERARKAHAAKGAAVTNGQWLPLPTVPGRWPPTTPQPPLNKNLGPSGRKGFLIFH